MLGAAAGAGADRAAARTMKTETSRAAASDVKSSVRTMARRLRRSRAPEGGAIAFRNFSRRTGSPILPASPSIHGP